MNRLCYRFSIGPKFSVFFGNTLHSIRYINKRTWLTSISHFKVALACNHGKVKRDRVEIPEQGGLPSADRGKKDEIHDFEMYIF